MTARKLKLDIKALLLCAAAGAMLAPVTGPVRADTLESALEQVYENNPTLNGERARLRATDEDLAKAQSGYRPQIGISSNYGYYNQVSGVAPLPTVNGVAPTPNQNAQNQAAYKSYDGLTRPGDLTVSLSQPLFDGFQTFSATKSADASIRAERERLRDTEQRALLGAITAYMDVLRDSAQVSLREHSLKVLGSEVTATQERFAVGEATRTDVAQAHSRQEQARADLEGAKAALRNSLADYQRAIGHIPVKLKEPTGFEGRLPATMEEAIAVAVARNPQVVEAAYMEKAAGFEVRRALGQMLPQASIVASHAERFSPSTVLDQQMTESATVRLNIPLYQSGEVEAQVRQAKQQHQGRLQDITAARDQARAEAISYFAQVKASRAQLAAIRQEVAAAGESLSGTREQQKAGQRTLLDVLNAEKELTDAQIGAVRARCDLVVSSYSLLAVMGRLTASDLGLHVALYDAEKHYAETNGRWSGTDAPETGTAADAADWSAATQVQR